MLWPRIFLVVVYTGQDAGQQAATRYRVRHSKYTWCQVKLSNYMYNGKRTMTPDHILRTGEDCM